MKKINTSELIKVKGGALSGQALEAIYKGLCLLIEMGIKLGSSLRRITSHQICSIK